MRALDAEQRMRELLAERGVVLSADGCGAGADAQLAWEALKAVAAESVAEPSVYDDGTEVTVEEGTDADLLLFESVVMRRDDPEGRWFGDRETLPATSGSRWPTRAERPSSLERPPPASGARTFRPGWPRSKDTRSFAPPSITHPESSV